MRTEVLMAKRLMAAAVAAGVFMACSNNDDGGMGPTPTATITWAFCSAATTPIWLAVQDGNGTWTRVMPTGTTFQFNMGARGGVAYVTPDLNADALLATTMNAGRTPSSLDVARLLHTTVAGVATGRTASRSNSLADRVGMNIIFGTQAELSAARTTSNCVSGNKTVSGSVANVSQEQFAQISLGNTSSSASDGATFTLANVPDGPVDLIATRGATTPVSASLDKMIIRRGLNPANNATLPVLDFSSAEAFTPVEAKVSVDNLAGDQAFVTSFYLTTNQASAVLFTSADRGAGPFTYYGVPTAKRNADDLHLAIAVAEPTGGTTVDGFRFAGLYFKDPTDRSLTLGPTMPAPTVSTVGSTPYVRLRAAGTVPADYASHVSVEFLQVTAQTLRDVTINATGAYLNGASYDLSIPDFTSVAGWDNNWGLKPGFTDWTLDATGFTGSGSRLPTPVDGGRFKIAFRIGTVTP